MIFRYASGINVMGRSGPQTRYTLTDDRVLYLDLEARKALDILQVLPGEAVTITKRLEPEKPFWWDIRKLRQEPAIPSGTPARQSGTSDPRKNEQTSPEGPKTPAVPRQPDRISAQSATTSVEARPVLTRTPPVKPTYEEAFRECVRIVQVVLEETGEQWSDGSRQAMASRRT